MSGLTLPNFRQQNLGGLRIAALYGVMPQQRGFCGPSGKPTTEKLERFISGEKVPEEEIRNILEQFEAVYPYFEVIAESNGIADPFATPVVKAYWLGNELLDRVSEDSLRKVIIEKFSGQGRLSLSIAQRKAKEIPAGSLPHHSFHVLVLGPVAGRVNLFGELLDLCRISWGEIIKIDPFDNRIKVKYRPLTTKKNYRLGDPKERYVDWNKTWIPNPQVGQQISIHWSQAVQILTQEDVENLNRYTQKTLDAVNSAL